MKRLSFFALLVLVALAGAFSLNSCQKDPAQEISQNAGNLTSLTDRSPSGLIYGVTLYDGTNPCQIVEMDQATGNVTNVVPQAFYVDNFGNVINLDNITGICLTSWGQYFLTTGFPANPTLGPASIYNDALFKVDPGTGQCSYASTSTLGTVSDLEHDPQTLNFYGLRNNNNAIVEIVDNNNNYGTYNGPFAVTGIAANYTLKGLSLVRDGIGGIYLVGCATTPADADPAKLYIVPFNGGAATFLTDLDPHFQFSGGHCAIGFDLDLNRMMVNRTNNNSFVAIGLSALGWAPPFAPVTPTGFWGGLGFDFEDLTSSVY